MLRALWDLGPSRVREVRDHLAAGGERLAYNTVQTLLNRLVEKGQVRVDTRGAAHVYRAVARREKLYAARIRQLLHELFDGSAVPLISHLLRDGELDPGEREELRRLIDEETRRGDGG